MHHFPDYVHAIHDDRRRRFETAAARAAMSKKSTRAERRKERQFQPRRMNIRQPRVNRSGFR